MNRWIKLSAGAIALVFCSLIFVSLAEDNYFGSHSSDASLAKGKTKATNIALAHATEKSAQALLNKRYDELSNNARYPTLFSRVAQMKSRRSDLDVSAEQVLSAMASDAWQPHSRLRSEESSGSDHAIFGKRETIKLNTLKIESLMAGDTLSLPIPQLNQQLEVFITRVSIPNETDNLMIIGKIIGDSSGNYVVISQDEEKLSAGIKFEDGHFLVQAKGNIGWIVASETLFNVKDFSPLELTMN